MRTFETIVDLIGNTRTNTGLRVKAELDKGKYPTGVVTTNTEMNALSLHRNKFHGDWNYELHPLGNLNLIDVLTAAAVVRCILDDRSLPRTGSILSQRERCF